jgi:hypothetical protein
MPATRCAACDARPEHIRLDSGTGPSVEIVGVARTIKYQTTSESPTDFVYMPLSRHPVTRMVLMVRSSGDPLELVQPLKDIVRTFDASLTMLQTSSYMEQYLNQAVRGPRIAMDMVTAMGAVGLLLAIAGLYGLVAYNVSRRTREIGIRMALGAASSDVLRLMMGKGLVLVGIGTAVGLAMGFAVERLMNSMVFGSGGVDVVAYLIVVPSLAWPPCWRSMCPRGVRPELRRHKRFATSSPVEQDACTSSGKVLSQRITMSRKTV